jgi:hypothetical protein
MDSSSCRALMPGLILRVPSLLGKSAVDLTKELEQPFGILLLRRCSAEFAPV